MNTNKNNCNILHFQRKAYCSESSATYVYEMHGNFTKVRMWNDRQTEVINTFKLH